MEHITTTRSTVTTTDDETAVSPLLLLASEIRVMIYELVADCTNKESRLAIGTVPIPSLAQTCRQLRQEVLLVLAASIQHNVWVVVLSKHKNVYHHLEHVRRELLLREQRRITANFRAFVSSGCDSVKASAVSFEIYPGEGSYCDFLDASVSDGVAWNVRNQEIRRIVNWLASKGRPTNVKREKDRWIEWHEDSPGVKEAKSKMEELVAEKGFDGFKLQDVSDIVGVYLAARLRARRRGGSS
ncbi:hypothetical protein LTR37_010287 [Vermiconidia calcicola]|uniref:Uncharacterized protein n=1 Tax=Vermiconidia calcicola TaxID=1690605 RepID=A0ACC3N865_9PEZI|nr:hypothetical protein LTR37_010287 [Vermiconidia calcicola]